MFKKAGELKPGEKFKYTEKDLIVRVVVDKTSWILSQVLKEVDDKVLYMTLADGQIHWTFNNSEVIGL